MRGPPMVQRMLGNSENRDLFPEPESHIRHTQRETLAMIRNACGAH